MLGRRGKDRQTDKTGKTGRQEYRQREADCNAGWVQLAVSGLRLAASGGNRKMVQNRRIKHTGSKLAPFGDVW